MLVLLGSCGVRRGAKIAEEIMIVSNIIPNKAILFLLKCLQAIDQGDSALDLFFSWLI
jgi:hypothetical protein